MRSLEQDRERKRLYREEHPERVQATQQRNYAKKRERRLEQKREYYERNKERIKEYQRQYRAANVEKLEAQRRKYRARHQERLADRALHKRSGFTAADKQAQIVAQGGACAICRTSFEAFERRHIHADHCHATGAPRGVLCSACNLGLGKFRDDPALLRAAAKYLERKEAGQCPIPQL